MSHSSNPGITNKTEADFLQEIEEGIFKLLTEKDSLTPEVEAVQEVSSLFCHLLSTKVEVTPQQMQLLIQWKKRVDADVSRIEQQLRSLQLIKLFASSTTNPTFERIVIGSGIGGSLVSAEMPEKLQQWDEESFPAVIAISDPGKVHTWPKERDRLMGQPAGVQTPQILSVHSEEVSPKADCRTNPYNYTRASAFNTALIQSQYHMEMPILNLSAFRIDSKNTYTETEAKDQPWEHDAFKHRIAVRINGDIRFLYTNHIDLCIGLGQPNRLTATQIRGELEEKLIRQNKLIYAQDGDSELKGEVVFIGSSAINAAWIAEITSGHSQPDAKIKLWTGPDGKKFQCLDEVRRDEKQGDATALTSGTVRALNRLIDATLDAKKVEIGLGELKSIVELSSGKLELTFSAPQNLKGNFRNLSGQKITCDQVVFSQGQCKHSLIQNISGFVPCYYEKEIAGVKERIPLGTRSLDGSIVAWGAAGTLGIGLTDEQTREMTKEIVMHAQTLPAETRAPGGIYRSSWTIKELAKKLREEKLFPQMRCDPHEFDNPDINLATLTDLIEVILSANPAPSEPKCVEYAKQIIDVRKKMEKPSFTALTGIQELSQLTFLPASVLEKIAQKYFPFDLRAAELSGKTTKTFIKELISPSGEPGAAAGEAAAGATSAFFEDISRTSVGESANAFVSGAAIPSKPAAGNQEVGAKNNHVVTKAS